MKIVHRKPCWTCFLRSLFKPVVIALLVTTSIQADWLKAEIDITTHLGDQQSFVKGDEISFYLSTNKAGYLYLFYRDASQQIYQLLPNSREPDNYYKEAIFVALPNQRQPFKFVVQKPYGEEMVIAYLSDNGNIQLAGQESETGLFSLTAELSELDDIIKKQSAAVFGKDKLLVLTSEN